MDVHDKETRSYNMSCIKGKGTKPEEIVRKYLFSQGFRYRKNDKRLPGSPDIAIPRHRIAIFVDGEFWHGKDWETRKPRLKSNREYWIEKIEENIARDKRVDDQLRAMDWTPIHFWSKDALKDTDSCISDIISFIIENEHMDDIVEIVVEE